MPLIRPEARYFSIPSSVSGWVVRNSAALNCRPCCGSITQAPAASSHSPAFASASVPTTDTNSRKPLTFTRSTAKPVSSL